MSISSMEYTLSEAKENYRRSIEFGNKLLVENFKARYQFYTDRKVEDARRRGISEDRISKWVADRNVRFPEKVERYRKTLANRVEGQVNDYVSNLKAAFGFGTTSIEE